MVVNKKGITVRVIFIYEKYTTYFIIMLIYIISEFIPKLNELTTLKNHLFQPK